VSREPLANKFKSSVRAYSDRALAKERGKLLALIRTKSPKKTVAICRAMLAEVDAEIERRQAKDKPA